MDFENVLDDLYTEFNQCRIRPQQYAVKFQKLKSQYEGNVFKNSIKTREGPYALQNLISDLNRRQGVSRRLKWSFALHMAADELANTLGQNGLFTTQNTRNHRTLPDRVKDYAIVKGRLSQIYEFGGRTSAEIFEQLLIDDGLTSRKRRNTLLDPIYNYIGIGSSYHQSHDSCTVIILAEDIVSLVAPDAAGKYKRRVINSGQTNNVQFTHNVLLNAIAGQIHSQIINPNNTQKPNPVPQVNPSRPPTISPSEPGSFILDDPQLRPHTLINNLRTPSNQSGVGPNSGETVTYGNNLQSSQANQSGAYGTNSNQSGNYNFANNAGETVTYGNTSNVPANQSGTYSNLQANKSGAYNSISPSAGQSVTYGSNVNPTSQSGAYNNVSPSAGQSVNLGSNVNPTGGQTVNYTTSVTPPNNQSGINQIPTSNNQSFQFNKSQRYSELDPNEVLNFQKPSSPIAQGGASLSQSQVDQYNFYKQQGGSTSVNMNPPVIVNPTATSTVSPVTTSPGPVPPPAPPAEKSKCSIM